MVYSVLFTSISLLRLGQHAKYVRLIAVNDLGKQFNEYKYIIKTRSKRQTKIM